MSDIRPMDIQGPYVPFEKPVPIPSGTMASNPKTSICFNSTWLPAVLGALKVLARPETWIGTKAQINATTKDAHDLIAAVSDGCVDQLDCSPVFVQAVDGWEGHSNSPSVLIKPNLCDGCGSNSRIVVYDQSFNLTGGLADLAFRFKSQDSGHEVGIHICELKAFQTDGTVGNVWQFAYKDCFGVTQFVSGVGTSFTRTGFDAQRIALSALAEFVVSITWDGPIVCEPA